MEDKKPMKVYIVWSNEEGIEKAFTNLDKAKHYIKRRCLEGDLEFGDDEAGITIGETELDENESSEYLTTDDLEKLEDRSGIFENAEDRKEWIRKQVKEIDCYKDNKMKALHSL